MDDLGDRIEILARAVADLSERFDAIADMSERIDAIECRLERGDADLIPAERAHLNRLLEEFHRPMHGARDAKSNIDDTNSNEPECRSLNLAKFVEPVSGEGVGLGLLRTWMGQEELKKRFP